MYPVLVVWNNTKKQRLYTCDISEPENAELFIERMQKKDSRLKGLKQDYSIKTEYINDT